jgi:hypothetical protein
MSMIPSACSPPAALDENYFSGLEHGDQMRLKKNLPKCSPTHFLSKLVDHSYCVKKFVEQKSEDTSEIF